MTPEEINKQYGILCQELGHLVTNRKKIEARLAQIEVDIDKLDQLMAQISAPKNEPAPATEAAK